MINDYTDFIHAGAEQVTLHSTIVSKVVHKSSCAVDKTVEGGIRRINQLDIVCNIVLNYEAGYYIGARLAYSHDLAVLGSVDFDCAEAAIKDGDFYFNPDPLSVNSATWTRIHLIPKSQALCDELDLVSNLERVGLLNNPIEGCDSYYYFNGMTSGVGTENGTGWRPYSEVVLQQFAAFLNGNSKIAAIPASVKVAIDQEVRKQALAISKKMRQGVVLNR